MRGANCKEAADRVAAVLARIEPLPEDAGRTEEEIMADLVADIAESRRERRMGTRSGAATPVPRTDSQS